MHKLRVAAAATVIALIGAFASMGSASAGTNGVGTTETQSSLVDVALGNAGSLLHLRVLGDDGKTTVDPAVGPVSALSELSALSITSSVLPVLNNISLPTKPWQALATSSNPTASTPVGIDLGSALSGIVGQNFGALNLPVIGGLGSSVLSGVLSPGALTGSVADGASKAGMTLSLGDLNLVGGLLTTHAVSDTLGAQAAGAAADGSRGLNVDAISVLNLGALLRGLGIDPANLVIGQVSGLLSGLQIPVAGIPAGDTLTGVVNSLQTTLNGLTGQSGTFSSLPAPVQTTVNGALGGLGGVPAIGGVLSGGSVIPSTDVNSLITTVTGTLSSLLPTALHALDGISLLQLNGIQLGAVTHAVNGTQDSKADVISKIGSVKLGGIDLGAVDLSGTVSAVSNLVNTISSTLDNVLAPLNLDGILHFGLFEKYSNNGVSNSGGYTRALAGITGLNLSINPPADLLGIVGALNAPASNAGVDSIGETITSLTGSSSNVPVVGGLMSTLNSALPSASGLLGALAGGASIKVADISSGSNFAAPSAATPAQVSTLPRTGANTMAFLVIGFLMVGGVLVTRRYMVVRQHAEQ